MVIWVHGRPARERTKLAQELYEALSLQDHTVTVIDGTRSVPDYWTSLSLYPTRALAVAKMVVRHGGYVVVCSSDPPSMPQGIVLVSVTAGTDSYDVLDYLKGLD